MQIVNVKFTNESYGRLSKIIFEKISELYKRLSNQHMALTVSADVDTLKGMSEVSFAMSRLTTVLHALETASEEMKNVTNVLSDMTMSMDIDTLKILREVLTEYLSEEVTKVNDYTFKLQSFVQLGRSVDKVTSIEAIDAIRMGSALVTDYSDLLSRIETALKDYAVNLNTNLMLVN